MGECIYGAYKKTTLTVPTRLSWMGAAARTLLAGYGVVGVSSGSSVHMSAPSTATASGSLGASPSHSNSTCSQRKPSVAADDAGAGQREEGARQSTLMEDDSRGVQHRPRALHRPQCLGR